MTLQTRLRLSAFFALLGLIGLAVIFYLYLPGQASEYLRRDAEKRLDSTVESFPDALSGLAGDLIETLGKVSENEDVQSLAMEDVGAKAIGSGLDLARRLCERFSLSNLVLIDSNGVLRSLHPEAARVGMKDRARLELARASAGRPVFSRPFRRIAEKERTEKRKEVLAAIAASSPAGGGRLWVLGCIPITRDMLESLALRNGAELSGVETGGAQSAEGLSEPVPGERRVPINGLDGARLLTVGLRPLGQDAGLIRDLLARRILMYSVPWVFFFALVILWISWPKTRKR